MPVSAFKTHDGSAHEDIVKQIPALRAFARSFYRDPADADDLVQETLVKALANLDKFEQGTRLKSWLFTIMRNTFCTRAKIARRETPAEDESIMPEATFEPTQELSVRTREVERAFRNLPGQYKQVLTLVVILGESYESAAEICDCSVGTVKSRLNRARHHLLVELGDEMHQQVN